MVRALTIPAFLMPDEPVTVDAGAGPAAPPSPQQTNTLAHPPRQEPASAGRQGRSPQKCFSGFTFFWKYKFRQKILLSEVEICRQKILILYLGMHSHSKQLQYDKRQVGCRPADEEP